jgi:hypothetical protein
MRGTPDDAVAAATAMGHAVEWDPPHSLSAAGRWTCTSRKCGMAVIIANGNIYGSAVEKHCVGGA